MEVRLTTEGVAFVTPDVVPDEGRRAEVTGGAALRLSELVELYRTSGKPLNAPLIEKVAA